MKFVPVTVSRKSPLPTTPFAGERLTAVGAGLLTVKVCALLAPPPGPGFDTVTNLSPAVAIADPGIVALTWVESSSAVVWATPPKVITELLMKFVPVTVSRKSPLPTNPLEGEMLLAVGAGLFTVKVCATLAPPPGPGFHTVTNLCPAVVIADPEIVALT